MSIGGICDAPATAGSACFPRMRLRGTRPLRHVRESEPHSVLIDMTDVEQT